MNIESYLIHWLNGCDFGVEAFADVPNDKEDYGSLGRPDKFITIERVGGSSQASFLDMPLVAVQCWAKSRFEASELANTVDNEIRNRFVDGRIITHCQRNSFTNFPTEEGQPRYQLLYDLVVQG